jgi:hypothetical protein
VVSVQSGDLTPEQADALKRQIRPMLVYLRRLVTRMNRRRFPSDDPLFRSALLASDSLPPRKKELSRRVIIFDNSNNPAEVTSRGARLVVALSDRASAANQQQPDSRSCRFGINSRRANRRRVAVDE